MASEDRPAGTQEQPATGAPACPAPDEIMAFLDGSMPPAVASRFEAHLDACAACRELVSALTRVDSAMNAGVARSIELTRAHASADRAPAPLAAPLVPGSSIGRYTVLEPLGAGGMGIVYAAYDPALERKVALKIVRTDIADADQRAQVQDRLLFEARAMAQLAHPNVVAVHDVGRIDDQVFVAMELVEGQTLKRWLAEQRRGWREIVAVFLAAGHGLAAAHAARLVHRDFKPANVLVGRDGRARVSDFGLAQAGISAPGIGATPERTAARRIDDARSGFLVGTPYYMAPEQFRGQPADARTDQFSFCVALYHALYRQHPFHGATLVELAEAVTRGRARLLPVRPRIPRWLSRAILRGLSTDPADRHRLFDDLLRALQRDPHRRVRRGAAAVAVAAFVIAPHLYWRSSDPRSGCADDAGRISAVWSPEARARLPRAFAATGKAYAPAALTEAAMPRPRTTVPPRCYSRSPASRARMR